ncbi:MAG: glycosyltransferase [Algoriphagus aquaeductus]|uniref:glycosyltransferase n=1 Tax=Algoriphagus aquaeductus TaxID=475299 RepID=UPI003879D738
MDTKISLGNEVEVQKFPNYEVHYLPFKPGILDRAYLKFGEGPLRPVFLLSKIIDVFLAQFTLAFTSFANFLPYLTKLVSSEIPDKLLISGEPFYLFRLGYSLNRSFGIPWIADYRDDWSTNELQMEKSGGKVRKWIAEVESRLEKKWVKTSEFVVSVSDHYTKRISNFIGRPGITVQNGFEESLLDRIGQPLLDQFTLVYSGILYPSQSLDLILGVLKRLIDQGKPIRLVFLGAAFDLKEKKRILALLDENMRPFVEVRERIPREDALTFLERSHAFLGMAYGQMKGIPSSKLYEYLALQKPVILCPTDHDEMERILKDTGLGFFAKNQEEGVEAILKIMELYEQPSNFMKIKHQAREKIMVYSRFEQLQTLAAAINK